MLDIDEVKVAARLLVTASNAPALYDMLSTATRKFAHLPIKMTGEYAQMNPLLEAYREDRETYDAVVQWAIDKRKQRLLPPLCDEKQQNKADYMREFMFDLRQRWRKAVQIENLLRSERDKLRGEPRRAFERKCTKAWGIQREALLDAERRRLGVQSLPRETMTEVLKNFWAHVDHQLDELEALALEERRKPAQQRQDVTSRLFQGYQSVAE